MRAYRELYPYYFVHSKHRSNEYLLVIDPSSSTAVIAYSQARKREQKLLRFLRMTGQKSLEKVSA
ncbi:MAG: hypothetical protein WBZ20_06500 [Nitrososphaeraceae archaeon]